MSIGRARIQLVLDKDLYGWIKSEAKRMGISLSLAVRDALRRQYDEWCATIELLSDRKFMKEYHKGLKDVEEGDVMDWRKVRKNV